MEDEKKCVFTISGIHRPLGFVDFASPSEVPLSSLLSRPFKFKLGNGEVLKDPDEAALRFLQREYPEITERHVSFPIFIPEFFLSEVPEVLNYDYAKEDTKFKRNMEKNIKRAQEEWEKKKKKDKDSCEMPGKITKIHGDQSEFTVFQQLQDILLNGTDEEYKPPKSLSEDKPIESTKKKATSGKSVPEQSETDFLVICQHVGIIISIECKSKLSRPTCEKVLQQLKTTFDNLSQTLSFPSNWKFVKVCSFTSIDHDNFYICSHCKSFTAYPRKGLNTVWRSIFSQADQVPEESYETSRAEFVDHVKRLVFLMHVNFPQGPVIKEIATKKLLENIKKASQAENIVLWTKSQHSIFYSTEKKVLLRSGFGTGKTLMLRSKALELANSEQERVAAAKKAKALSEKSLAEGEKSKEINSSVAGDKQVDPDTVPACIYFLIFGPLALADAKHFFQGKKLVNVLSWEDVDEKVQKNFLSHDKQDNHGTLKYFLQMHADSPGIFIDEYTNRNLHDGTDRVQEIVSELCSRFKTQWAQFLTVIMTDPSAKELLNISFQVLRYTMEKKPDTRMKIPLLLSKDPLLQVIISDMFHAIHRGDDSMDILLSLLPRIMSLKKVLLSPITDVKHYIIKEVLDADIGCRISHIVYTDAWMDLRENNALMRKTIHEFIISSQIYNYKSRDLEVNKATAFLNSLASVTENHLWIALNSNDRVFKSMVGTSVEMLRGFCCPYLGRNLRSVQEIVEEAGGCGGEDAQYAAHTNPPKGRCPKVIKLVIRLPEKMAKELFLAFREGYDHLSDQDGRVNDLAVLYTRSFGPAFVTLQGMIVDFLSSKKIPVFVVRADGESISIAQNNFFSEGRKGVILGDTGDFQGCEFKSVIAYFPLSPDGSRMNHEGTSYATKGNVILRAMCNLVVVEYTKASSAKTKTNTPETEKS